VAIMPLPEPPSSLDDGCTVIHENTLYSFSPAGFVSIRLEEGAEWEELESGEPVTGAACVSSLPPDGSQAGFFVVGGAGGSTGLQKYTYATRQWTALSPPGLITKERQGHSAIYIPANDAILVYAGHLDGSQAPSTETFSIDAYEPYEVSGYTSTAPPVVAPIMLRWSGADAVMLGGDPGNQKIFLFNPTAGWRDYGASLAEPIAKDVNSIQAALMQGTDGSQNLYLFDLTESPNQVSRIMLQDGTGAPVQNSAPITARGLTSWMASRKRDLTEGGWPEYNSTLAPTTVRSNYAIAQDANGMVVFTGGNAEEPLSIFDASENSWMDAERLFLGEEATVLSVSTSTSSASFTTASSSTSSSASSTSASTTSSSTLTSTSASTTLGTSTSATATEAPVGIANTDEDKDSSLNSNTILGITLGSIFGLLTVLALIFFLLRCRRMKKNPPVAPRAAARTPDIVVSDEKDPRAFMNASPSRPPPSPGYFRGHYPQNSQDSYSSMAILMGRANQPKTNLSRKGSHDTGRSSVSSLHKEFKSTISKPIPQSDTLPSFQRNLSPAYNAPPERRQRNITAPDPQDETRRSSGWNRYWSGGSALQLLGFGGDKGGNGAKRNTTASDQSSHYSQSNGSGNPRVTQDSATVPPLNFEGRAGVSRVNSGSPIITGFTKDMPFHEGMAGKIEQSNRPPSRASSGYSSGIPESVNDAWDPTHSGKPWGADRAPSSVYASSFIQSAPQGSRQAPSGVSRQPQLAMASTSSDMSWLNLGDQSRR
jgi:hypothetical protein